MAFAPKMSEKNYRSYYSLVTSDNLITVSANQKHFKMGLFITTWNASDSRLHVIRLLRLLVVPSGGFSFLLKGCCSTGLAGSKVRLCGIGVALSAETEI